MILFRIHRRRLHRRRLHRRHLHRRHLHEGKILASGKPSEVLTVENIALVFGVSSSIEWWNDSYIRVMIEDEIKEKD